MRQLGAGVVIKAIPGGLAVKHEASKVVPSLMPEDDDDDDNDDNNNDDSRQKRGHVWDMPKAKEKFFFFKGFIALVDGLSTEYPHKIVAMQKGSDLEKGLITESFI